MYWSSGSKSFSPSSELSLHCSQPCYKTRRGAYGKPETSFVHFEQLSHPSQGSSPVGPESQRKTLLTGKRQHKSNVFITHLK